MSVLVIYIDGKWHKTEPIMKIKQTKIIKVIIIHLLVNPISTQSQYLFNLLSADVYSSPYMWHITITPLITRIL